MAPSGNKVAPSGIKVAPSGIKVAPSGIKVAPNEIKWPLMNGAKNEMAPNEIKWPLMEVAKNEMVPSGKTVASKEGRPTLVKSRPETTKCQLKIEITNDVSCI